MENKKSWLKRHLVHIIFSVVVLAVLVVGIISGVFNNQNTSQSAVANNTFVDKTIQELTQMLNANNTGSLVNVQGTITQKGELSQASGTSFFLKIEDQGVDALIMPKDNVLNNFSVGDLISVNGALGNMGDCSKPDDPVLQKVCQMFNLTGTNLPVIIPIKLQPTDSDITIIKKSSTTNVSANTVSESSYVVPTPKTQAQPTIPLTYSQIMNGLGNTFTMGEFTSGNNHGYSSDNSNLLMGLIVSGEDKEDISSVSFDVSDPSVGYDSRLTNFPSDFTQYRTLHDQVISQLLTNIFPGWEDGVQWLNGAVSSCKQNGSEPSTVEDSMKISVSCSTTLGMYAFDISHD